MFVLIIQLHSGDTYWEWICAGAGALSHCSSSLCPHPYLIKYFCHLLKYFLLTDHCDHGVWSWWSWCWWSSGHDNTGLYQPRSQCPPLQWPPTLSSSTHVHNTQISAYTTILQHLLMTRKMRSDNWVTMNDLSHCCYLCYYEDMWVSGVWRWKIFQKLDNPIMSTLPAKY